MQLHNNMEFEIKDNFIPNLNKANRLKILEVSPESVVVQMQNSKSRGVFPIDHFQYYIRKNLLVHIKEEEERLESTGE
ncbi:hypothetical protein [Calidifontibacillus erzurumensis]|uniref:Uncharacterized protein n=1 Tax=Calidifontibacillus erzurumensis TaxID=2741433 RepID=A0A8J8GEY9_9BACI|nr:hypothetical protein [Calidifontibacillus erzurumensis]NSL52669.1 hypothetical protein [Calidifontibacillus erzurumensis]